MIKENTTIWAVQNSSTVVLEDLAAGLKRNRKGLQGESSLHLGDIVRRNDSVTRNFDSGCNTFVVSALLVHSLIRIGLLSHGLSILIVSECESWISAAAAEAKTDTVH